jgi:hypothetical protein
MLSNGQIDEYLRRVISATMRGIMVADPNVHFEMGGPRIEIFCELGADSEVITTVKVSSGLGNLNRFVAQGHSIGLALAEYLQILEKRVRSRLDNLRSYEEEALKVKEELRKVIEEDVL